MWIYILDQATGEEFHHILPSEDGLQAKREKQRKLPKELRLGRR
jgi:hypothetical protein